LYWTNQLFIAKRTGCSSNLLPLWYTHALLLGQIADTLSFTKEKRMSDEDFATSQEARKLADEIAGLKMMITLILKGMGQADAGKVIINMERYVQTLGDKPQAEVFSNTIKQIKTAYRQ
jgi:hypothetical protein